MKARPEKAFQDWTSRKGWRRKERRKIKRREEKRKKMGDRKREGEVSESGPAIISTQSR